RRLDLGRAERHGARLARQPERAQRRPGEQTVDLAAEIRRHGHLRFERPGELALPRGLVDMLAIGSHPAAPAGQVSLQVRYDGAIRTDDETDELIRPGWPTRDDAGAIVHLVQSLRRAGSRHASASAGASASAATSSGVIQPAIWRAASTISSASARETL